MRRLSEMLGWGRPRGGRWPRLAREALAAQGAAARRAGGADVAELAHSPGPSRAAQVRYRADALRSPRRGASGRRAGRPARLGRGGSEPRRRLGRALARPWRRRGHGLRRDAHERGQDPGDRRHRREPVAAVLRRGAGEGAARSQSAGQTGERAQALPQPGRHRHRRAHALRRLAKRRRRQRDRGRRGADRRGRPTAATPACRSWSAKAPMGGCANMSGSSTRWTN